MTRFLDLIVSWVVHLMSLLGAPGVGIAVALENVFPPIPSEIILPAAGFAASRGTYGLFSAIVWATAGSVIGACVLYAIGALIGHERMSRLIIRLSFIDEDDVARTENWFERHGPKAVFIGRLIPVIRSFISIPAGVERMPIPVFLAYTTVGSALWNSLLVGAGFFLGENWTLVGEWISHYQGVVLGLFLAVIGLWIVRMIVRRRRQRRHGHAGAASSSESTGDAA
ncbi:DedA family protein [Schaalia sp. ZJ1691]|uniref:DedA family protein n=1 Tax=Schaalia sp. ZJ1691 TaxID=2709404 RepID=UPI0013ED180F|nr:DedA family protein [Schaalia sp. ZJ1691]